MFHDDGFDIRLTPHDTIYNNNNYIILLGIYYTYCSCCTGHDIIILQCKIAVCLCSTPQPQQQLFRLYQLRVVIITADKWLEKIFGYGYGKTLFSYFHGTIDRFIHSVECGEIIFESLVTANVLVFRFANSVNSPSIV